MTTLKVLVLGDDPLARAGLVALLGAHEDTEVVGQISLNADAVETYMPDVLLVDLGWEPASSIPLLTDLAETLLPVLALLPDDEFAAESATALQSETVPYGLLPRNASTDALLAALNSVQAGLITLDPSLTAALAPRPAPNSTDTPVPDLTPREHEVLDLLAEGLPNKTIALRLEISEHTVKFHVNAILSKLGAASRTEAAVRAARIGLISL